MRANDDDDHDHAIATTLTPWQRSQSTGRLPPASCSDAGAVGDTAAALSQSTPSVVEDPSTVITLADSARAEAGEAVSDVRRTPQHLRTASRQAAAAAATDDDEPATGASDSTTSSSQRRLRGARSRSEPVVTMMLVHSDRTAYHQKVAACDVRRSKSSRVRTYLKRCRDALIGSIAAADTIGSSGSSTSTTSVCPIIRHEAIEQRASCTSWYVDETAVAVSTADGVNGADSVAGGVGAEEDVGTDARARRSAEEGNPIDLPTVSNSVACQSVADIATDCCCGGRADADYVCNDDQLSQSSADTVLDMDALMAHSDRLIAAEQQSQQQSQRNDTEVSVMYYYYILIS